MGGTKRYRIGTGVICLTMLIFSSCQSMNMKENKTTSYAFRLKPGEDLREGIEKLVKEKDIKAGWLVTCAGSLTDYSIRFANQPGSSTGTGHFEIVSLTGTVSINGSHLHISISDSAGRTIGGHLLPGCKIYTTAEIVLQSTDKYEFTREKDGSTSWDELQVKEIRNKQ
jgi:predicted DNA-binding protein with PD1-like motif